MDYGDVMFDIKYISYDEVRKITYKCITFSGGEVQVFIDPFITINKMEITITAAIESANQIMELLLVCDALRRYDPHDKPVITLVCPYLPYARQDRVMNPGESLSVKVFADIINSLNFDSVWLYDVHSDVATALINNCQVVPMSSTLFFIPVPKNNCVLVAPDAGANKKVQSVAKAYGMDMVRADKIRDTKTGEITDTVVYSEHIGDRDFLITDDICDGGRTFIELAKKLRPLTNGKVYLYVTHGIFSKGLDVFDGIIDQVFCPFVFSNVTDHKLLTRMAN